MRRTNWPRAVAQWLRLVAPPAWTFATLVIFLVFFEAACVAAAIFENDWETARRMHLMRDALLTAAAGMYGVYRVWQSHPLFQNEYREFLARTPWDRNRPLPLAPLHLVPQDILIVALLLLPLLFRPLLSPAAIVTGFLFAYLAFLALALVGTNQPWFAWLAIFALGLSMRLAEWNAWAALLVVLLAYPLVWHGVWRSLAAFPWDDPASRRWPDLRRKLLTTPQADRARRMENETQPVELTGLWPWNVLSVDRPERNLLGAHAWAWAAQAGWWTYALAARIPEPATPAQVAEAHSLTTFGLLVAAAACGLVRLVTYIGGHRSPLNLWGRIASGRFIIPAYDVVAVTPLAVLLLGVVAYPTLAWLGLSPAMGAGVTTALLLGLSLTGAPRLRRWQLTAPAKLIPVLRPKGNIEAI